MRVQPWSWSERWIGPPADWAPNIVQGRSYDLDAPPGSQLWTSVLQRQPSIVELIEKVRSEE